MQAQKFDPTKPYGQIYNHPEAMYEQNGVLFDANGNKVEVMQEASDLGEGGDNENGINEFLANILSGGPVLQSVIKKESEIKGMVWADVTKEAADMGILKYKSGVSNVWKLASE